MPDSIISHPNISENILEILNPILEDYQQAATTTTNKLNGKMAGMDRTLSDFESQLASMRMLLDQQGKMGGGEDIQLSLDNLEDRFIQIETELKEALDGNRSQLDIEAIQLMIQEFKTHSVTKEEFESGMGDKADKSSIQDIVSTIAATPNKLFILIFRYIGTNSTREFPVSAKVSNYLLVNWKHTWKSRRELTVWQMKTNGKSAEKNSDRFDRKSRRNSKIFEN